MKASGLREMTLPELEERETSLRRELWKAKIDNFTNQLDDTAKVRRLRRDLARIKTVLHQRRQAKG